MSPPVVLADLPQAIVVSPADGGLPLIRSLARRGVRVTALVPEGQAWIARTRAADGRVLGNLPEDTDSWLAALEELAAAHGEGVLISGSDRATELLVRGRDRIPDRLRSFESPASAHLSLMDKASLDEIAQRAGVRRPWTLPLRSREDLERVREQASYPCLLKPALSHVWRRLFGEHRVLVVDGPTELEPLAGPALEAGLELLLSEFVPGPERNLENAVVVRLADGSRPLVYELRRLRQYPPVLGASALTESAALPDTMALGTRLLDEAGFAGLASVQTKRHDESGEPYLIEVNVRVPQHFGLGDAVGLDASWRLYSSLAGLPLGPQPEPLLGVRNVVPSLEPRAAWTYLRDGGSLAGLVASYRGVRDVSGLAIRDPGPALALAGRQVGMAARALRRSRADDRRREKRQR